MNFSRIVTGRMLSAILAMLVIGGLCASPSWAQTDAAAATMPPPANAQSSSAGTILKTPDDTKPAQVAAVVPPGGAAATQSDGAAQKAAAALKTLTERLARLTSAQRRKWDQAQAALPAFCRDWDRMLHEREMNNLSHLEWHQQQGFQTATYTGYGKVQGCEAKESEEGVPLCKVTYQEMSYYLAGKSVDEARAHPKLLGTTNTLEIFSFEKDRWFY